MERFVIACCLILKAKRSEWKPTPLSKGFWRVRRSRVEESLSREFSAAERRKMSRRSAACSSGCKKYVDRKRPGNTFRRRVFKKTRVSQRHFQAAFCGPAPSRTAHPEAGHGT